jgi:hypothetical protein
VRVITPGKECSVVVELANANWPSTPTGHVGRAFLDGYYDFSVANARGGAAI